MYYTPALNPTTADLHYGEKTNFVCNWGNNFASSIMQFYFQLIRTSQPNPQLETQLASLLHYTQKNEKSKHQKSKTLKERTSQTKTEKNEHQKQQLEIANIKNQNHKIQIPNTKSKFKIQI